jgi:hypothetical protein
MKKEEIIKTREEALKQFTAQTESVNSIPVIMIHGIPLEKGGINFRISVNSLVQGDIKRAIVDLMQKWVNQEREPIEENPPVNIKDALDNLSRN